MKQESEDIKDLNEIYEALNLITEEYQEYFKVLAALPSIDPSFIIETGYTSTPYGETENNARFE